jgi:hypothetical protein
MVTWVVTQPKDFPPERGTEFFEQTYKFLTERYGGERNVISGFVHKDEVTPHIHFAFVPVVKDKKSGIDKVSAKEAITKTELNIFHKRDTVMSAEYAPQEVADLWICACGNINRDTEENCFRCRLEKQKAFTAMDKGTLQANLDAYNEGLRRRAEQEKAKEEEEAEKRLDEETQRTIKTAAIFLIVILCVVIGWRVFNTFFS